LDAQSQYRVSEEPGESILGQSGGSTLSGGTFDVIGDSPAFGIHDGAKMVECSPDLAEMFGHEFPDEMIGREPLSFIDPAHQDQSTKEILGNGGGPYCSVGLRADGVKFRIEVTAHCVRYRGRQARLVLIRDLSPRALVVDDNEVVRNMVSLLFRKLGYRALAADSAEAALHMFRPGVFQVVLSDIVMPGAGGIQLALQLRAADATVPVLLMSGYSEKYVPLDEYTRLLKKPFGIEDLSRELMKLPDRARAGLV
jgi:CheY-like chemotaxis protein